MEPKAAPGTPWEGEISLGNFSGGPPEDSNEFFFRPRGAPGAFWESPGEAPGAHLAPKRAPEASRSHFGTIFGAKMEPRGFIFQAFLDTLGLYFGHLRPLLFQASRLCCCLVFAWGCSPSFSFPPCALRSVAGSPGN